MKRNCELAVLIGTRTESILLPNITATLKYWTIQTCWQDGQMTMQVCFYRQLFPTLSSHQGSQQSLWGHWGALIRLHGVPNCCRLSRPDLWSKPTVAGSVTYWMYSSAACVLLGGFTPPTHSFIHDTHDISFFLKAPQSPALSTT